MPIAIGRSIRSGSSGDGASWCAATNTLYFDYASDRTFELTDGPVLGAIMDALRDLPGPFRDFELERQS